MSGEAKLSGLRVRNDFVPSGDQPRAVAEVAERFARGERAVVLAGATGTGKSATAAWVIQELGLPTLVLAPNKVLAAQLASELRDLLPEAYVGYFVSHFAYYRPEAYVPSTDTYIEKDSAVDSDIERLRHEATAALLSGRDAVVVASVSAIYGLGRPKEYLSRALHITTDDHALTHDQHIAQLVRMGYSRNDMNLERGRFRVRGAVVDVYPSSEDRLLRLEFFGDDLDRVSWLDPVTLAPVPVSSAWVFPVSHHVIPDSIMADALAVIEQELAEQVEHLTQAGRLLEAQRLTERTQADLESLRSTGFCRGIENYSRHFDGRSAGEPPACLVDYFPDDFLLVIDESHVTVPQLQAMYEADQSRKRVLVEHGFRLPSALDNRPLSFDEFLGRVPRLLALSATPGAWEADQAPGGFVDQVVRPTGLVDPAVRVEPQENRMEVLLASIRQHVEHDRRSLVTTVSKAQAETLADFLTTQGIRSRFLHSDVSTVERIETLRDLRRGAIDTVVGVNLLREGLDLPEVGLVAVLDADARGFLRSATSLVQTIGRAARNPHGEVILFADEVTPAMRAALDETDRRRRIQIEHNLAHDIVPTALVKPIHDVLEQEAPALDERDPGDSDSDSPWNLHDYLFRQAAILRQEMKKEAEALQFERAAALRDEERRLLLDARALESELVEAGVPRPH